MASPIQVHKLDSEMPNCLAAWCPPTDCSSCTASDLNSSVYRRVGTDVALPSHSPTIRKSMASRCTSNKGRVRDQCQLSDSQTPIPETSRVAQFLDVAAQERPDDGLFSTCGTQPAHGTAEVIFDGAGVES